MAPTRQSFKSKNTRPAQKVIRAILQKYMQLKNLVSMGKETVIRAIYIPTILAILLLSDLLLVTVFFCKD